MTTAGHPDERDQRVDLPFTGEYLVPGCAPRHLEDDHVARYRFALPRARDRRVLDIACGTGYGAHMLAREGAQSVHGIDISANVVAYAQDRYRAANLTFAAGDITTVQATAPFELITCFETIEHVPDHRAALTNLKRLLQPGGELVVSSPNRPVTTPWATSQNDKPANPHHVREFTPSELRADLQAAGFTVDPLTYGQRFQLRPRIPLLRKVYKTIFRPWERSDPTVRPCGRLAPEYFVLVARS